MNSDVLLARLRQDPPHYHRFLAPCPTGRLTAVEQELGKLPPVLGNILRQFNGAELFVKAGPALTLFGISTIPPLSPLEWAQDWYIDKFTPAWRAAGTNRQDDWAIAMTSYGVLSLLDPDGTVKEWDTNRGVWEAAKVGFAEWLEKVIREGEIILAELAG